MIKFMFTEKQQEFLKSTADVCMMAGGAGSGKSYVMLFDALGLNDKEFGPRIKLSYYRALLYRKQFKHLNDLIDKSKEIYPKIDPGAVFTSTNSTWKFSSGAEIQMMYFEEFSQVEAIQGRELHWIGADEQGQYQNDRIFRYCLSRLRSSQGLKTYYRATSNPSRYKWLKDTFKIDATGTSTKFIEKYTLSDGTVVEKTFQYIQAMLKDNPYLGNEYEAQLMLLPEDERNALLYGRWDAYMVNDAMVYKNEYDLMTKESRITTVRYQPGFDVYAAFDLGFGDYTSVIIFQICGKEYHILESFENNARPIEWYAEELKKKTYTQYKIILPHDAKQHSLQTGLSMEEKMKTYFTDVHVLPRLGIEEGISETKSKFPYVYINKSTNDILIDSIINYERSFNTKTQLYGEPIHNKYSHMADAFRYVCVYTPEKRIKLDMNLNQFSYNQAF